MFVSIWRGNYNLVNSFFILESPSLPLSDADSLYKDKLIK